MISHILVVTTVFVIWSTLTAAFRHTSLGFRNHHSRTAVSMSDVEGDEITFNSVVVSGFISKENDFAEAFVFSKLHKTGRWKDITAITDNIKYARKRMMSPGLVYSGLTDILKFAEIDKSDGSLQMTLDGKDAWLNFNVTAADVSALADIAVEVGLKRVVFAVCVSPEESGEGVTFDTAVATLSAANIAYTIIKYGAVRKMGEAKFPYKIVRGDLSLPSEGDILSSDDLMRVLVEIVDLPKSYNTVYGIGPGTRLDAEISVYMKAMNWPDRVQIGIVLGDFMETLQVRYDEEVIIKAEKEALKKAPKKELVSEGVLAVPGLGSDALPKEGEGNKFAGFF